MRVLRFRLIAFLLVSAAAFAGESARATPAPVLPTAFGGWQLSGAIQTSPDSTAADPLNAALLKEYGFTDFASGTYLRDDGRKVTIKAARFADASGAYGAFTFYKMPQMVAEQIGDQGASLDERVVFYRGNILVDAVFQKLSAMSAAELRELAASLPKAVGNAAGLPGLPAYLPRKAYVKNSAKYVVGPLALEKVGSPLSAKLVDFGSGAEVALANYDTAGGEATLTLISYPTPQIAAGALQRIDAEAKPQQGAAQSSGTSSSSNASPLSASPIYDKRTGPIIAIATGALSPDEAKSLLGSVNYDADVTWNQNTFFTKKDNIANLLVNVIILCGIIGGLAIVAGIAFGGFRVLIRRMLPEQAIRRREEMEFISLHLSERRNEAPDSGVS
jgi:hypothetical protein